MEIGAPKGGGLKISARVRYAFFVVAYEPIFSLISPRT
jgi:hypothetical protein